MIEKLLNFIREVFDYSQKLQRNTDEVARLENRVDDLADVTKYLAHENQRLREYIELRLQNETKDRENALLRLKIEMLESGRALSSSTPPLPREESSQ